MRKNLFFIFLFNLGLVFFSNAQSLEGNYQGTGYFFHPSASRYLNASKSIVKISDNKYQVNIADLGGSGYAFQFDVDANNNLVNWLAVGSAPASPASGFMTMDNPGGFGFYPGSTSGFIHNIYSNRYDPLTKTFYFHYGYQGGGTSQYTYQRQVYERLEKIPQPHITSISPLSGSYGTVITVKGTEFTGTVPTLGLQYPNLVDSFSVLSDSVMKIWVGYASQNVNVRVYAGTDSSSNMFAYTPTLVSGNSQWNYVGSGGFSNTKGKNVNMALNSSNIPYVVYVDSANRTMVMKFQGGAWSQVGGLVSDGLSALPNIKIGSDNLPMVCYQDSLNGNNITVKKFDGSNWILMGSAGFAPYNSFGTISMSLDAGNMPYVLSSAYVNNSRNVSVYKYNGNGWVNRGTAAYGVSEFSTMDVDKLNNLVYVAYADNNYQANVKKLMDTSWMTVGNGAFTNVPRGIYYPTIRVDKFGRPYVVMQYDDYHERLSIYRLVSGVWTNDITDRFTKSHSYQPSLTFDKIGLPVLAFTDGSYSNSGTVMTYSADSGKIVYVGGRGFEPGINEINALQVDTLNNFYIAFSDKNNDNRVSVMKFGNNESIVNVINHFVNACSFFILPWGDTIHSSGNYSKNYTTGDVTDSIVVFQINLQQPFVSNTQVTSCNSYLLPWDSLVTSSGLFVHRYERPNLCDSIIKINVNIISPEPTSLNISTCDQYLLPWGDTVYQTGIFAHTYYTANGCDSIVTAYVAINYSALNEISISSCGNIELPWGDTVKYTGTYSHTYQGINGCDSILQYSVVINRPDSSQQNVESCDNFMLPWGIEVTESGTYSFSYNTINGCDSIVSFIVKINKSKTTESTAVECNQYILPWGNVVTETGDYSYVYQTTAGCDSTVSIHVTINVADQAMITNLTGNDTITCSRTSINLAASSGASYEWSNNLSSQNIVTVTSPGTYSVVVTDVNGCSSSAEIIIEGSNLPQSPVVTNPHPNSYCGSGKDTLSAFAEAGTTIDWYDAAEGGNRIIMGSLAGVNKFITPVMNMTTTYYAEKRNISFGCVSESRTEATIQIAPLPSVPEAVNASRCGAGSIQLGAIPAENQTIDWYAASTGTIPAFKTGSLTLDTNVITSNRLFYAVSRDMTTGCVSTARTMVTATYNALPTPVTAVVNASRCGEGSLSLTATAPSGTILNWYADSLISENILTTGVSYTTPSLTSTNLYWVVSKSSAGCYASSLKRVTANINALPTIPVASGNARCGTGSVVLTAVPPTGGNVAWYNISSGGTSLSTLPSYTTASLPSTTTYYVESKTAAASGSCISSGRTEVIAIVNSSPSAPTAVNASRCGAGSIQLGATPSDNQTIDWYAASTGTTPPFLTNSQTLDTNLTTANRLFYAASRDLITGCVSAVRTTVTATYNALPAAVTTVVNASRCGEGTLSLSATAPLGTTLNWYADSLISENILTTDVAYTTPSLTSTNLYWVVSKSAAGCYASSLKKVTATINAIPNLPIASGNIRCGTGTIVLTAIPPTGGTVSWYNVSSGGTSLSTLPSYTTASLSSTVTYFVESKTSVALGSCISSGRTEVIGEVRSLPSAPIAINASRCGAGSIQLGATPSDNQTIDWYGASTGTTPAFKTGSLTLDTNVTNANRLFYAASRDVTTGCVSTARTTVTATYNALPAAVTTVVNGVRCGEGTLSLSATAPTGTTLNWYADSLVSENILATGVSYTTPSLTSSNSYWVVTKSSAGCFATSLKRVTATINALPSLPEASGNIRCGTGTVVLTAIPPTGGTVSWYNVSSGGTALSTLSSYTTASLSSTTTYYVESKSAAASGSCTSSGRTEVIAIVNSSPSAPIAINASRCGSGFIQVGATPSNNQTIDWYTASTGTTPPFKLAALTLDTNVVTSNRLFYAVSRDLTTGCVSSARTTVTATYNALPAPVTIVVNGARCGEGTLSLSATAPSGTTLSWYADSLISGNILATGVAYTTPSLTSTNLYWVVSKSAAGCYATSLKKVSATINVVPSIPVASGNVRCGTGTVVLTAVPPTGGTVSWYNVSSGGTALSALSSYTTASLSSTTTYYVESKMAAASGSCISTGRTEVIAVVNPTPSAPVAINASRCGIGLIQIGATPSSGNQTIDWFAASTGTTPAFKLGSLTLDTTISATKLFYAATKNIATGCLSTVRTTVTATYNAMPSAVSSVVNASRCGEGAVTMSATPQTGTTIEWYSDSSRTGSLLNTGNSYSISSMASTKSFWLISKSTVGCYSAAMKKITATINQIPAPPVANGNARCSTGTVLLTATAPVGGTIGWYNTISGGTALSTTANYTTPSLISTSTYYVEAKNSLSLGSCPSSSRTVAVAIINEKPASPIAISDSRCGVGLVSPRAIPASNETQTIDWYTASTGTTAPFKTNLLILDTVISSTKTFYVASRNIATGCVSNLRSTVIATISTSAPSSAPASITSTLVSDVCGARIYRFSATSVSGATSYNWNIVSNDASIQVDSGSNGNVVRVLFPSTQASAVEDSIKINAVNPCGSGPSRSLKLNLVQCTPLIGKLTNESDNLSGEINVSLSPNPTNSYFNFNIKGSDRRAVSIRIFDAQGRFVKSMEVQPNEQTKFGSELKAGVYFMELKQGEKIKTTKMLKY